MSAFALSAVLALVFGAVDEDLGGRWLVRADVQMVSVSRQQALALVPQLLDAATTEAAVAKLQEMIASGGAKLVAWPMILAPGGQRAVSETNEEVRYPTEFLGYDAVFGLPISPPGVRPPSDSFRGTVATIFETWNTSPTFELEAAVLGAEPRIHMNVVIQHVRHLGMQLYMDGQFPTGAVRHSVQPEVKVNKVTTSLSLASGRHALIAAFS